MKARNCFLVIRCQPDERAALHALAKSRGMKISELVKGLLANTTTSSNPANSCTWPHGLEAKTQPFQG